MRVRRLATGLAVAVFSLTMLAPSSQSAEPRRVRLGYFEGGAYPYHSRLRDEFQKQLNAILPDSIEAVYVPGGFRTADWDKTKSVAMAKELAGVREVDLVVAVGPWVVHDLLAAGCKKPIVAMHQFAPQYEGLIGKNGRPKADNLTIHTRRDKIKQDLARLAGLMNLKKLGLIYFPSSNEADSVLEEIKAIGVQLGFEVVSSSGVDNKGTFAIFNAYNALDKKIDALYMPPMWGLDIQMINQFLYMTDVQRLPVMTSEDKFLVERGAFLTNSAYDIYSEARFNAYKAAQIILGAKPSDLPVEFSAGTSVAVNEKTAQKCRIQLKRIVYLEAEVIAGAETDDSPALTLSDAMARAVAFSPGLLAQKDAMESAAQAASQAYSEYLPHLTASAGIGYRNDNYINNSRGELKQDYYVTQINLRQKIFSLETIRSIQIAAKKRDIENTNTKQVQQQLELAVTRSYLNYLKAQEALAVLKRIRELVERNIEISGTRFVVENGSEYEHSRWRVERDKSTKAIIDATNNLNIANILLGTLLNYPIEQKLSIPIESFGINSVSITYERLTGYFSNSKKITEVTEKLVGHARENNSLILKSRQRLDIQRALLSQNKSRYLPSLNFIAAFRHADELSDTPPPFKEEKNSWTIGGFVNLPLFLGTDRIREKRKLKAAYSRFEYDRDDLVLNVTAGVRTSLQNTISNFDKLPINVRRVDRTRYNLEIVVNGYDAGEFDIQYMIDEMQEITAAEIEEIMSRYGLYESMADLAFELGWIAYGSGTTFTQMIEDLIMQD